MEPLNFIFKKDRKFGEVIQDFITLFKLIFGHLNRVILSIALPFIAIFILASFYMTTFFREVLISENFAPSATWVAIPLLLMLLIMLVLIVLSAFAYEYMLLLEEKGNKDFTSADVYQNVKLNIGKYVRFFLVSIVVGILLMIPYVLLAGLLNFLPVVGQLIVGVFASCMMLFMTCALLLYRQDRAELWGSFGASFSLIRQKIFSYGAALYILQLMIQIILMFIAMIPIVILAIIGFATIGFSEHFFDSFTGKFLASMGMTLLMIFGVFTVMYMAIASVLQYFSLLESSYREDTLEQIDQIGGTADEF